MLTEYSKDLSTYLQYCKDVVFAGLEPSFEDYEEEKAIEQLWEFYQKNKVIHIFHTCWLARLISWFLFLLKEHV